VNGKDLLDADGPDTIRLSVEEATALGVSAPKRGQVQDFGFFFWALDPNLMLPGGDFAKQMAELVARIKATPRLPGVAEIRIPSERAFRERERRRREGIVIERNVVESLRAL
jgi:LDH2 family malate/lactate/ureidoglycolate dehydrogenase